jgi:hypothetical protein
MTQKGKKREYKTEHFSSARDLIERLSPLEAAITNRSQKLIYRGQADAVWSLVPALLRDDKANLIRRIVQDEEKLPKRGHQILYEEGFVETFVNACDSQGLVVPGDSPELRKIIGHKYTNDYIFGERLWPDAELLPVMALAQHHGVPTRLLDWTKYSYVAAFFAASSAIQHDFDTDKEKNIAIWALDVEGKNLYADLLEIVDVPGATSINLAAQGGCFTCVRKNYKKGGEDFDEAMDKLEGNHLDRLWKFTAPASTSKIILQFCEYIGITASILFPGYDGAAKHFLDSVHRWDRKRRYVR